MSQTNKTIPQVNLVILGTSGVGKTTFIQKALDYREPPNSRSSAKKMSLDDVVYMVRLLEIPLENVALSESRRITWPKTVAGTAMPPVDGVLMLFDVTNKESISEIPETLSQYQASPATSMCHHQAVRLCCNISTRDETRNH